MRCAPFRHGVLGLAVLMAAIAAGVLRADPLAPPSGPAILQEMKAFQQCASVLMIAAHPDDENTQLITYLARGREYRMAYLSVTRGDGGQNLLGPEFGDELGLIRTHELLAARQLDGGRQFFTRAIDFGFSKNPEETLRIWDRKEVLGDVVRVIRTFRPDVVVTRFSPTQTNTHGHHTASAILGVEAFKLAGDPKSYPEQLTQGLAAWQPKRIMLNGGFGRGGGGGGASVQMDIGGVDPVVNEQFGTIANHSRAMHKTQGFGQLAIGGGGRGTTGARLESFSLLDGAPASKDIMDGIDTTWARYPGGEGVAKLIDEAIAKFDMQNPAASVPALLEIKRTVAALAADPIVNEKRALLDRIIADCLGLTVETTVPDAEVVPGETLNLHHAVHERASVPISWNGVRYPAIKSESKAQMQISGDKQVALEDKQTLPADTPVSQPYWLRKEGKAGIFQVDDPSLIGRPENPPSFPVEFVFDVAGQTVVLPDEPVQLVANAPAPQARRRLDVIAAVSLAFPSQVRLFSPGVAKSVEVEITAHRPNQRGTAQLGVPAEWKVEPSGQAFTIAAAGGKAQATFTVTSPSEKTPLSVELSASAKVDGATFTTSRKEIRYDHIPVLLLQPPATIRAVSEELAIRGKTVGYLPGAGDSVAECLEQMGYSVKELTGADLTTENLKPLDAVVIGVRAFNTRTDLAPDRLKYLFGYVEAGGTVVEQYNRPDGLRNNTLAPYPIHLSGLRVTDETAKVTFLAPDHPALNTPNKITDADFDNWVQERSIYLPDQWDPKFVPILASADPGEQPPNSALLIAPYGKGNFVYTSLVFFRQLPAGNPGAYRLFANLVSLGK